MFPEIFHIGDFFLPTYGLLVTLGFLAGLWIAARLAGRSGIPAEPVLNLGIYVALAGLIGARLLMFALDWRYYVENPTEIFSLSTLRAGGIFYGGLILALITAILYMRKYSLPALLTADCFAPGLALGHSIGRLGCFAAGCCWGAEHAGRWSVTFTNPQASRLVGVPLGVPLYPTQLFEALAEAAVFAILMLRFRKAHRPGAIIGLYLTLYSTARFLVEFIRFHDPQSNATLGPFVLEQWIALGLAALGVWLMARPSRPALGSA
jgi:phosphatidylglycerol:prolipoprotein diacylglycerol transferase